MDISAFAWGIILLVAGVFIASYGSLLFRFALAAMGFGIGFLAALYFTGSADTGVRVLISLAAGGILAFVFFALVRLGTYIAGGIFGLVVGLVVANLLRIFGLSFDNWFIGIVAAIGLGGGSFFAPRFGSMVTLLASAASGALLIVNGLMVLFGDSLPGDDYNPGQSLGAAVNITVFAVIFALSFLSQRNYESLRRRIGLR